MIETLQALIAERGEGERIWGSMIKQALKRRNPGFNESYYGFKAFSDLLEEAEKRKLITLEPDEKSGGYLIRPPGLSLERLVRQELAGQHDLDPVALLVRLARQMSIVEVDRAHDAVAEFLVDQLLDRACRRR